MIRKMEEKDRAMVFQMMRVFYDSPALLTQVEDQVLHRNIADCIGEDPFVEGFMLEKNGEIAGYCIIAKSYSTEFGGRCIWVEDLYLKPEYRFQGLGSELFAYVEKEYKGQAVRLRLEVEGDNEKAILVYRKNGFEPLPYLEMTKEI